jgi:hypothetical protein
MAPRAGRSCGPNRTNPRPRFADAVSSTRVGPGKPPDIVSKHGNERIILKSPQPPRVVRRCRDRTPEARPSLASSTCRCSTIVLNVLIYSLIRS